MKSRIPKEVKMIAERLNEGGFDAYLVGGCVRDIMMENSPAEGPSDWDVATNAKPEEIQKLFSDSVYENEFGTVGVKTDSEDPKLKVIEVTTFRIEGKYSDKRHPDEVTFASTIEEDLSRRDFTVNAMALKITDASRELIVDPYHGQEDLKKKIIRAVGKAEQRFEEDALRLLRAIRFSAQLGFAIEEKTAQAITKQSGLLAYVSKERIRDEFTKLMLTDRAAEGVRMLLAHKLLIHIAPEIEEGISVTQNKHHIYTVFEHNLRSLEYAVAERFPLHIRLASLFHDVGKPRSKKGDGPDSTFYGHQVVGERMTATIMDRLRFSKTLTETVALLVREHMFVYDPEAVTLAGVRRLIARVGKDNVDALLKLREADRIGSGVPKAQPYRLRYLRAMIEKVQKDPVSPKMLKANGEDVMRVLKMSPGPRIGKILAVLLEEVLEDPKYNTKKVLEKRIQELGKMTDKELEDFARKAKESASAAQHRIDEEIKKKYFVK
ncbi:MAG: HD domain-containing protein [Patescibacteria group bacterium]